MPISPPDDESLVDMTPTLVELLAAGGPLRAEGHSVASAEDALIDFPWKLITAPDGRRTRLFDLGKDPSETQNLAVSMPGRVKAMLDRLYEFDREHSWLPRALRGR